MFETWLSFFMLNICFIVGSAQTSNNTANFPEVTVVSEYYQVDFGKTVTLDCNVTSESAISKLYWRKIGHNEQKINSKTFGVSGANVSVPSLTIHKATKYDEGNFTCIAVNAFGRGTSRIIRLDVIGDLPSIRIGSSYYSTEYESSVTLTCNVNSTPPFIGVYWKKYFQGTSTLLNNGAVGFGEISIRDPSLTITSPKLTDIGNYTCFAYNEIGTSNSLSAYVHVSGDVPVAEIETSRYEARFGTSVELKCNITSYPPHHTVYWEKDVNGVVTRIVNGDTGVSGITLGEPSITIINVTTSAAGHYKCHAVNKVGIGSSAPIELKVIGDLPKVTATSESYIQKPGSEVTLGCNIVAEPTNKYVYWTKRSKDKVLVINNGGIGIKGITNETPSLTFQSVGLGDSGLYNCYATNDVGTSKSQDIKLTVTTSTGDGATFSTLPLLEVVLTFISALVLGVVGILVRCYFKNRDSKRRDKINDLKEEQLKLDIERKKMRLQFEQKKYKLEEDMFGDQNDDTKNSRVKKKTKKKKKTKLSTNNAIGNTDDPIGNSTPNKKAVKTVRMYLCEDCDTVVKKKDKLIDHLRTIHRFDEDEIEQKMSRVSSQKFHKIIKNP